jgi:hypothetical protein
MPAEIRTQRLSSIPAQQVSDERDQPHDEEQNAFGDDQTGTCEIPQHGGHSWPEKRRGLTGQLLIHNDHDARNIVP